MFRVLVFSTLFLLGSVSLAQDWEWVITESEKTDEGFVITESVDPPENFLSSIVDTRLGHIWKYANGSQIYEIYSAYAKRTGKPALTCSTGYCSQASAGPVKPCAGCNCGCSADSCNCSHSPNVGVIKDVALRVIPVPPVATKVEIDERAVPSRLETSISMQPEEYNQKILTSFENEECANCQMMPTRGILGLFRRR